LETVVVFKTGAPQVASLNS